MASNLPESPSYWVRPVHVDQWLAHQPALIDQACRVVSLAHYGQWYRLDLNQHEVTCCIPGPLGPARVFLWVAPATATQPLRVKYGPRLAGPESWQEPEGSLAVQLRVGAQLAVDTALLVERVQPSPATGGTYYRLHARTDRLCATELLLEARPR